jgi:hypothetical protein
MDKEERRLHVDPELWAAVVVKASELGEDPEDILWEAVWACFNTFRNGEIGPDDVRRKRQRPRFET